MARPSEQTGGRLRRRPHRDPAALAAARWRLVAGLATGYVIAAATAVAVLRERSGGVLLALFLLALVGLYLLEPDQ